MARIVAFVAVSAFCVIRGGAKFLMPPPSTGGTPVVPVMQFPAAGETPVVPVVVTPEEIAQDAISSNGVEVVFARDADGDGILSRTEETMSIGMSVASGRSWIS